MRITIKVGDKIGNLTVSERDEDHVSSGGNKTPRWICECNRGHKLIVPTDFVKKGYCYYCSGKMVLAGFNDFKTKNPKAAEEWNYDKNTSSPNDFLPYSNKKVWWICSSCGGEWKSTISSKNSGHGCPYCTNHKPSLTNNLAVVAPDLAAEWNYVKNGNLKPEDISPNYNSKVWWICKRGHEWQAKPNNRMNGRGCRVCSAEMRSSFPEQAVLFYLGKNAAVSSRGQIEGWEIDVYLPEFKIGVEYDGIAWHTGKELEVREARKSKELSSKGIYLIRIKEDRHKTAVEENVIYFKVDSDYTNLDKAIEKLLEMVSSITKINIMTNVDIKKDRVKILSNYVTMEKENSFEVMHKDLVKYWNFEKNVNLTPDLFTYRSNRIVWWKCDICSGEWQESIINVSKGNRCPYCSGHKVLIGFNDLSTTNPELNASWDFEKNYPLKPEDFSFGSNRKVWWKCDKRHTWKAIIHNRAKGVGCPYCAGKEYMLLPNKAQIERWEKYYKLAESYYKLNGDLLIPANYITEEGAPLGSWIRKQRMHYKNNDLTDDRIEKLNNIKMVWIVRKKRI